MILTTMYASPTLISMLSFKGYLNYKELSLSYVSTFESSRSLDTNSPAAITYHWMLLSDEYTISDAQVFDQVTHRVHIKAYLEVSAAVLFRRLLVFVWDDEVVHDALDCCRLLIQVTLMLLDALLAAKVDTAITQILFLALLGASHRDSLHVCTVARSQWVLRVRALGLMADQAQCIDLNLFTFDQRGRRLDQELENRSVRL